MNYYVLAYYIFTPIQEAVAEVTKWRAQLKTLDAKGRIYISEEGVNGQMSIHTEQAQEFIDWLHTDARFASVDCKLHLYHEHAFEKMTVKYRKQLAALDTTVDISKTGRHVSPKEWKEMLENRSSNTLLIDVRNRYEWEVGHFEGAELPQLETFRDFKSYAMHLKESCDIHKTKIMMYCTGGIRCELYSSLLKEEGFEDVCQLEGGIIGYGLQEGVDHWRGKLFVFDDRLVVPIAEENTEVISVCKHCDTPSDKYINCANMDCNELFLACPSCAEKLAGCCCDACLENGRVRPFSLTNPKPFRKLHAVEKQKLVKNDEVSLSL